MSIRLRFTIALTLLGLLLFGGYAVVAYTSEVDDLHDATEREILTLGRSLATSLGNALRDRQRADIDETLRALESLEPKILVHVHDVDAHEIAHSRGEPIDDSIELFARRATLTAQETVELDATRIVYAAPLTSDSGDVIGAIVVIRVTDDLKADLARTRWRLIAVVVGFVAVTMIGGVLLGTAYVTRPLAILLDGIAHVRDGDFKSRVQLARHDEIGALVDEFNAMVAALGEARQQIEHETEARLRLERGLQGVDKMITIGQLSAGLAHEIGSPLQVLSGRASALALRSAEPETRRQAEILVEQCARITRIVEQLLSLGRRRPAVIAACDLVKPVKTVLELLDGEVRRRGVTLELQQDDGDHAIDADEDQLQQIVLNLIRNALSATPSGGRITVRVDGHAGQVRLIVRDTGPGIPPEMQANLFEPFFTTRASEGGTGLGLAVVRAIVVEHGGTITAGNCAGAADRPGGGAEFIVSFPARRTKVR
ncbi:MAG TPA: HAMP domain-containing sensor histidine kinase [Kofleriaceae bacterium]|nr:HAMP domain-containing sensor histidine kinase [Kofleriaceae bacterium]